MSFPFLQPYAGLSNSLQTAQAAGGPSVGGWVEVGRTTLGSNGQTIDITSIPDKRYYMVLFNVHFTGAGTGGGFRLNNDSGSNYAWRYNQNGQYEQTFGTNQSNGIHFLGGHSGKPEFYVSYISNLANKEKLCIMHRLYKGDGGATSNPFRHELVGKWTNTSNAINQMTGYQGGSDNFTAGDEIIVLGWDQADEHTSNFWEELASVDLSGGSADQISSGTLSAKKYVWMQLYIEPTGAANINMTFNNDTSTNYVKRNSNDGGADGTTTSASSLSMQTTATSAPSFHNLFMLNNTSNEKLIIHHAVAQNTAGASTAPQRKEQVMKWVNTTNQITEIDIDNTDTGSYDTKTILKVWGAD